MDHLRGEALRVLQDRRERGQEARQARRDDRARRLSSACTCAGETSAGRPNTGPTVIGGMRTVFASTCSDGRFGERRRATVPAGRSTRRKAAELNAAGHALVRQRAPPSSAARSACATAPARGTAAGSPWSIGCRWRRTIEPSTSTPKSSRCSSRATASACAELLPGGGDELLLAVLDDLRAQSRPGARRRVQVELAQPARRRGVGRDGRLRGLPVGVDRRADDIGAVEQIAQRVSEGGRRRAAGRAG